MARFTLQDLSALVERALLRDYAGQENGQIREIPDPRTIRYYTTLGLVDRPAALSGRTALYGRRHLLQIVAIKRLQARGLSLAKVQEELLGLSDASLARIARLPPDADEAGQEPAAPEEAAAGPDRSSMSFWQTATASAGRLPPPAVAAQEPPATFASREPRAASRPLAAIPVSDEVTLLVAAARPLEPADVEAVRDSLSALFNVLAERRLIFRRER
jgi:DNA-binding transcriptional MerR regulator